MILLILAALCKETKQKKKVFHLAENITSKYRIILRYTTKRTTEAFLNTKRCNTSRESGFDKFHSRQPFHRHVAVFRQILTSNCRLPLQISFSH